MVFICKKTGPLFTLQIFSAFFDLTIKSTKSNPSTFRYSRPYLFEKLFSIHSSSVGTDIPVPLSSHIKIIGTCPPWLDVQQAVLKADSAVA